MISVSSPAQASASMFVCLRCTERRGYEAYWADEYHVHGFLLSPIAVSGFDSLGFAAVRLGSISEAFGFNLIAFGF